MYLIFMWWHSSVLYVRSSRGIDANNNLYLVVGEFKERLALIKQAAQNFDLERVNLKKLNGLEVRKQYQIMISDRSTALNT